MIKKNKINKQNIIKIKYKFYKIFKISNTLIMMCLNRNKWIFNNKFK